MPRRELVAFVAVPFIATAVWYVVTLGFLGIWNGRLRWTTDVVAIGIGAAIIGLPASAAATVLVALPAYAIVRSTIGVTLPAALIGGAATGLSASLVFWAFAQEWSVLSPLRGCIIGIATAWLWWRRAGRPGG